MSNSTSRLIHYVVFHRPGPKWQYGVDFREQDGVSEHVQHYLMLHQQGKLELGGPFLLQDAGGMMITTKDVSREEIETFAAADSAIASGLLTYEVRPWMTAMQNERMLSMYQPNPQSEFRVKFDFRVDFTNGGYVEGHDFLLDLEGDSVSDEDLKVMIVDSMNLAKAGEVQLFKKEIVRRGEHQDAA